MRSWHITLAATSLLSLLPVAARGQATFAVASIRPAAESVRFESDGETKVKPGAVSMRDVTIETCIKWAYSVQRAQVSGPGLLTAEHYDISAKADDPAGEDAMKKMMQTLLADRFKLTFHHETRDMRAFALSVAKSGAKLKPAAPGEIPFRENSAIGTVARALTMQEFADFISGPLQRPVLDRTGLPGRYNFAFDFTNYLPKTEPGERPDFEGVLNATLQGEVGLRLDLQKSVPIEVMVVDHIEKPSPN